MIFNITTNCFHNAPDNEVSDFVCAAIKHGHYLVFENGSLSLQVENIVKQHGSTTEKKLYFRSNHRTGVPKNFLSVLTVVDVATKNMNELLALSEKAALLFIENDKEWDVYQHMIDTYKHDTILKFVIPVIVNALQRGDLKDYHCGGIGNYVGLIRREEQNYLGLLRFKALMVIDRDVDEDVNASGVWVVNNNRRGNLYMCLSGKTSGMLIPSDIYTLHFPVYLWHMWYKRTIENYFPDRAYVQIGCDLTEFNMMPEDRDYRKIDKHKKGHLGMIGYEKNKLADLTLSMSRIDYETGLKHFYVNGKDLSELQLFLMKILKIV